MANSLLTTSEITREALRVLKNNMVFCKSVNRQYDDRFAKDGAKRGDTINIRKPPRYSVTDGKTLSIQDSADASVALQLDTQRHVGMAFSSKDLALSIDAFSKNYIEPAMVALANDLDYTIYSNLYKDVYHSVGIPSATSLPNALAPFVDAKAKIALAGGQVDPLNAVVDPLVEASLVEGLKGLFQSSEQIKQQYEKGMMGMAAGSLFKMSQNVVKHTVGALGGTPVTNYSPTAFVAGASSLVTDGWSNSITGVLKAGDVISIADVYAVNPQNRQSTGQLAQFVVQSDVNSDGSGNATITLDRAIYASGQNKNVNALPGNNKAITIFGHASSYAGVIAPQNLVFHKDAFVLGCADLPLPKGVDMAARAVDPDSGLSIRMIRDYNISDDEIVTRLDILFGSVCVWPEYACRVVGRTS